MIIIFQYHPELVWDLILNKGKDLNQVQVGKLKDKKFGNFIHSAMKEIKNKKRT